MRADLRAAAVAVTAVAVLGIGGCSNVEDAMSAIPVLNFMRESPALDPYEAPRPAPLNSVPHRSPGEHTEPRVERTEAALVAWGDTLTNPLPMSKAVLARGQEVYDIYCTVCHGPAGHGDGPIIGGGKFPFALDLTLPGATGRTDGYLYAVTRVGRGLMPGYQRIPPSDRWAVVNYMRQLQQADPATAGAGADADEGTDEGAEPMVEGQE